MAEALTAGYQNIRDHVQGLPSVPSWSYISLMDTAGTEQLRLPTTDARCSWTHTAGAQVLNLRVILKGSDADVAAKLPLTLSQSAFYTAASGGSPLTTEAFSAVTLAVADDQLTLNNQVQVPIVTA